MIHKNDIKDAEDIEFDHYEENQIKLRLLKDKLYKAVTWFFGLLVAVPLVFILGFIVVKGIKVINWGFFTSLPKPPGEVGGGVANAIVGSMEIVGIAAITAIPFGIAVGVFLYEYTNSKFGSVVRLCAEVLQGIPSIVIGIVAYLWIVIPLGGFSALSAGFALALMMLPVIIRSTEETLLLISNEIKEASMALGVPYHKTIIKVIIPAGMSGISTGVLLGLARIVGETAPLLFTAFGNPYMNVNLLKPVNALPLLIFNYATSPYLEWQELAWGASFVLIIFILLLNISTKVFINHGR